MLDGESQVRHVAIIGGGIAGLSTAYFLREGARERGIDLNLLLLEKSDRLGGNILTERIDDFIVEGGPDCFLSEKPWALRLCKRLGLEERLLPTNENSQTFVLWKGRLHPLPEGFVLMIPTRIIPFIFSSLISIPGKLRMALEPLIPKTDVGRDVSLGEFITRRFGREVLEKIAEPLVAGVHAGNPETMSLKSSFPKFLEMEQEYNSLIIGMLKKKGQMKRSAGEKGDRITMFMTLKDGLSELTNSLVKNLNKVPLLTGREVLNIDKDQGNHPYTIHIKDGEAIGVDSIVLTTPAYISARLIQGLDPLLSERLREIPYVSTATISLAFKKGDIKNPLRGFGLVVPRAEKRRLMAATWTSLKFPSRSPEDSILIRCFVGGSKNEALVDLEDKEMIKMIRDELRGIVGIDATPLFSRIFRWEKAMPQYTIGHSERVEWIEKRLSSHRGIFLTGSAYRGIGISDCVHNGEVTARLVLDLFQERF